ncbi:MAG: HlyD family secretion protein [Pseudomonadota bacterium]
METLILLTYGAICFAAFRVFKIPVTGYSVVTAIMGGFFILGTILLGMNFNHPYTNFARTYFITTPIVPAVPGRVVEVPVAPNRPVAKGDVLFRIDPEPYELRVAELEAQLAQTGADVRQDNERIEAAQASVDRAEAALELAQQQFDRDKQLVENGTIAAVRLEQRQAQLDSAIGAKDAALAEFEQAQEEVGAVVASGDNAKIAEIEAQLATARWNLEQTTVVAPEDGMVTQLALREGYYAVNLPLRPAMDFVTEVRGQVVASFRQIGVQRLEKGDEAEVAFFAVPGRVFSGKVADVLPVMAAGEIATSGSLVAPERNADPGRVVVLIDLDEEEKEHALPGGAAGVAAVYSEHWHPFAVVRAVLMRVKSWTFYLSFEH